MKKYLTLAPLSAVALFAAITFVFSGMFVQEAHAGGGRVVVSPPNPVTVEMQQARTVKYNAFHACLGARFHEPAVLADTAAFEQANNASGFSAMYRDLAGFNAQVAIFDAELARLNPIYGC